MNTDRHPTVEPLRLLVSIHPITRTLRLSRGGKARVRAGYSYQQAEAEDTGERLTNSPQHLATLNVSTRPLAFGLRVGASQYVSSRKTTLGTTGAYTLVNLTLRNIARAKSLELAASVYNLLDRKYDDPASPDLVLKGLGTIAQDGRTWQLRRVLRF